MSFKVFISYASKDEELASEIRRQLSRHGHDAFLANADVLPGQDWAKEISGALSKSEAMVVLLSPEAVESAHVRHEINYALGSQQYEGRVLPVVVRRTKDIPWFLQTIQNLDVTGKSDLVAGERVAEALSQFKGRKAG